MNKLSSWFYKLIDADWSVWRFLESIAINLYGLRKWNNAQYLSKQQGQQKKQKQQKGQEKQKREK